jgi:hypothetical protein
MYVDGIIARTVKHLDWYLPSHASAINLHVCDMVGVHADMLPTQPSAVAQSACMIALAGQHHHHVICYTAILHTSTGNKQNQQTVSLACHMQDTVPANSECCQNELCSVSNTCHLSSNTHGIPCLSTDTHK